MEAYSDNNLVSNHLISDVTEDVVLLDSAATISADLTEATGEDQTINIRHAKDEDASTTTTISRRSSNSSSNFSGLLDDVDDDGKKDESQNERNRKHEVLPVSTNDTKCELSRSCLR